VASTGWASAPNASDDDAVAVGLGHHPHGVVGRPDVAVAEHGDARDGLLELADGIPVGVAGVELARCAGVERDGCSAGILGRASGIEEREVVRVDALAHLDGQRQWARCLDRLIDDVGEEPRLPRQRCSSALAGDLRDGASEVQVDVVGVILGDDDAHGFGDGRRIDAVELDRAGRLGLVMADEAHRRVVALDEGARGDHLADVEAGAVLTAEPPERRVRDACHGCEDDRHVEFDRADAQGAGGGRGDSHFHIILPSSRGPVPHGGRSLWI
jgi:hypothetical protein